ncbi:MAG: HD domain-containing protein [Endomicrobiales bacterium]|nr:HD domain-containing protein [Endomicrobiales bacterium]
MKINYRKALEKTARQMILVHRVNTLIKLVLRTIMRNIKVGHSGIFLFDKDSGCYIVKVSRGPKNIKIPENFTRIEKESPIIQYFIDEKYKIFDRDFLLYNKLDAYSKKYNKKYIVNFLKQLKIQMQDLKTKVCIPGFFRDKLLGVLFLGEKMNKQGFKAEELSFLSLLSYDVVMAIQNARLFEDLNNQLETNKRIFFDAVNALGTAIETKDNYTGGHIERVVNYSIEIAENLKNIDLDKYKEFKENLIIAALLHDIGKIGIPERVLNKKTGLNNKEKEYIRKHPIFGIDILDSIKEYGDAILGIKHHHERYDGKGYPSQLRGNQIPLIASIVAVADAFDAMTTNRPYRKALTRAQAIDEIKINKGKQFHPKVVDAFLKARKYEEQSG